MSALTKAEFLAQLQTALVYNRLPLSEVDQSLAFYTEIIDDRIEDGMSEQDAVAQLGDINQIAAQIIAETPFVPRAVAKAKSSNSKLVLIIVLLVVLLPVWLPLAIGIIVTLFSLYITIWVVLLSLWIVVLGLAVTGFICIAALFYMIFTGHALTGLLAVGFGLVCLGLAIFCFFLMLSATKGFAKFTVFIVHKIKSLFVKEEGQS